MLSGHKGHRDRVRKKFLGNEIDSLEDHEILELMLYYAIPRRNTNDIAHNLLEYFGSLPAIFDAPVNALKEVEGMGENAAIFVKLVRALTRLYMERKYTADNKCMALEDINNMLACKFIARSEEVVAVAMLDSKGKVLFDGVINKGSVTSVDLYIRKIIELVTFYNASAFVMAHNHPSGIAVPSNDDLLATQKIVNLFGAMHVSLLDHIIVADNDYTSIRQTFPKFFDGAAM